MKSRGSASRPGRAAVGARRCNIMGDLEAYRRLLPARHHQASLGLGWVGELAVAALCARPAFTAWFGGRRALRLRRIPGVLLAPHRFGEQVPKTFAIRSRSRCRCWSPGRCSCSYLVSSRSTGRSTSARALICGCSGQDRRATSRCCRRARTARPGRGLRQHGQGREARTATCSAASSTSASRGRRRHDPPHQHRHDQRRRRRRNWCARSWRPPTPACRYGATIRRTSSASSMPRTCCARPRFRGDTVGSTSRPSRCRPGSCRTSARCPTSSRRSAAARRTSRSWSTSTARSRAW